MVVTNNSEFLPSFGAILYVHRSGLPHSQEEASQTLTYSSAGCALSKSRFRGGGAVIYSQ